MSRTLHHWGHGITRVSPALVLFAIRTPPAVVPARYSNPTALVLAKSRELLVRYSFLLCSYSFATRTWLCSYSSMDELKKLVLVRGRVRARYDFGHVRVREVPVAVAYPKSNSHLNSNSCVALVLTQNIFFGKATGRRSERNRDGCRSAGQRRG